MYDFLNIIESRKQAGLRSKCTDYEPTKNEKVIRFFATLQVKQTPEGQVNLSLRTWGVRKRVLTSHFCRLIIGTFWAQPRLF